MAKNKKDKSRYSAYLAKSPNSKTRSGCSFRASSPTLGSANVSAEGTVPHHVPAPTPSGNNSILLQLGSKSSHVTDLPTSNPLSALIQDIESSPPLQEFVTEPVTCKSPITSLLGTAHHRWCDAAAIYDIGVQSVDSIVEFDIVDEGGIDAQVVQEAKSDCDDSVHPYCVDKTPFSDLPNSNNMNTPLTQAANIRLDGLNRHQDSGCVSVHVCAPVNGIESANVNPHVNAPVNMIESETGLNQQQESISNPESAHVNAPVSHISSISIDAPSFQVKGINADQISPPRAVKSSAGSPHSNPDDNPLPSKWSSLFTSLPKIAGNYVPTSFSTTQIDGVFIPPIEVVTAGTKHWEQHLVGFFLDASAPYSVVRDKCKSVWNVKGSLQVQFFNTMFYFKFSNNQDKLNALEKSPLIIDGKPFIITPWSQDVDKARERVMSIPVWATFTHIPSILQPLVGLNWLASLIGDLKCFDTNTVERKSLHYARALIEISPSKPLPSKLPVRLSEGNYVEVDVNYRWKPDICSTCCSFGHLSDSCSADNTPPAVKVPLTKPSFRWVPKPKPPPVQVVVEEEATPETPLASDTDTDHDIYWSSSEQAWVHEDTEMRYQPATESFYKFVGEEGEERCLYYQAVNEDIVLCDSGEMGESNTSLLEDATWDRKYLYGPDSSDFTPTLYSLFLSYLHVVGPDSSEDGNDSSSFEEG